MKMLLTFRVICFFLFATNIAHAQNKVWTKQSENKFLLNTEILNSKLAKLANGVSYTEIVFPNIEGNLEVFKIYDNAVLPKALAEKYPRVHSFKGIQKNDTSKHIRFTCNTYGLEATLLHNKRIINLTRISGNNYTLITQNIPLSFRQSFECSTLGKANNQRQGKSFSNRSQRAVTSENIMRTVRLAVATTGETSQFFINKSGLQSAPEADKKAAVLAGISTSINNVNVAFERDLGVRFNLIENNDELIFLDSNNDPFSGSDDLFVSIEEGRIAIENRIPFSDYDLGHLITLRGNGGLASIGAICSDFKGDAVTGFREPEGFFFDFTLFAHELGHQLGGSHTQSAQCQIEDPVEAGSGTTIMGYSGACGVNDVQPQSDPFFHSQSIEQIFGTLNNLDFELECGIETMVINNSLPEIPEINDYVVPVGVPLYLDVEVTDANVDDRLTYSWEQYDQETGASPPEATSTFGPQFRVFPPIASSRRDFPTSGVDSEWEVLPLVERTMNFRLSVRDGNPGGIAVSDVVQLSLVETDQLFEITLPSNSITYGQNESQLIEWEVAGTNASPFNVSNVKIEYSFDGGITYPVVLAESVPNSGSTTITTPQVPSDINDLSNGKIRISALENAFYTISKGVITLSELPETSIVARQDLRDNLLIFNISSSFEAPKSIELFPSFTNVVTNEQIEISDQLLVSVDSGATYIPFDNNLIIASGQNNVWLALPLSGNGDLINSMSEILVTLNIPFNSRNTSAEATGFIVAQELSIDENIVFNNPSKGVITLTAKVRQLDDYIINMYNINGGLIRTFVFGRNDQEYTLDAINTGLYIVRISLGENSSAKKLIVY